MNILHIIYSRGSTNRARRYRLEFLRDARNRFLDGINSLTSHYTLKGRYRWEKKRKGSRGELGIEKGTGSKNQICSEQPSSTDPSNKLPPSTLSIVKSRIVPSSIESYFSSSPSYQKVCQQYPQVRVGEKKKKSLLQITRPIR
jgi:hypothetical protein